MVAVIKNMPKYDTEMVKTYGKVLGLFDGPVPNLWVTDIELIKSIFVKDFDHFVNRRVSFVSILPLEMLYDGAKIFQNFRLSLYTVE